MDQWMMLKFLHFASGLENYYINPYRRLFFSYIIILLWIRFNNVKQILPYTTLG